jgi:hypothetical protein
MVLAFGAKAPLPHRSLYRTHLATFQIVAENQAAAKLVK